MTTTGRELHRPVVTLDADRATDGAVTGGKGANLARLVAADFPVPPGFCVTTDAYRALVDDPEIRRLIASLETLDPTETDRIESVSARIRSRIRSRDFPEAVRRAVDEATAAVDADAYAVRSSATAEDLPTASFAGQHETYLGVEADAVLDRVRECMASLFTDRAVTYRLRNDVPHGEVAMAVVVQAMVDAAAAGVLFTADPVSGNRRIASVDANFGLGDTVVAGDVSPDDARVDRRTGEVLEYAVGDKRQALRSGEGGGTETVVLPPDRRAERVLSDEQLRTLAALGGRVEELLDAPQDVEWALVDGEASTDASGGGAEPRDGEFVVLQSRPITSLFPVPSPVPDDDELHVYLSFGHLQAMPEAMPPLVLDFFRGFVGRGLDSLAGGDGPPRVATAGGRLYADLTPLLRVDFVRRRLPARVESLSEPAADGLRDFFDRRPDAVPDRDRLADARAVVRFLRGAGPILAAVVPRVVARFVRTFLLGPPDPKWVRAWCEVWGDGLASRVRDGDDHAGRVHAAFERPDLSLLLTDLFPRVLPLLLSSFVAARALRRLVPDADEEVDAVGKGFEAELVTRMNQRLGDLADLARERPAVEDALRRGASLDEIEDVEGGADFRAAFDEYLHEFGHRATGEIDLSRPRWRDDPATLLRTVRSNLAGSDAGAHREHLDRLKRRARRATARLETRAGRGLLGPVRRRVVRRLVRVYRGGMQVREFPKQGAAHFFAAVHDAVADAGDALAADGRLDDPDDVWFLRSEELLAALSDDEPIDADVDARRRAHDRHASLSAPPLLTSDGEALTGSRSADAGEGIAGTPVSAGVVEGTARVVRDPAGESLESGEILVAPSTDPGWTPLFLNAAGLVMEIGGRMTHGALVAREYGIPAVASVTDATTTIRSGDRIRVDGERGTVELLDRVDEGSAAPSSER